MQHSSARASAIIAIIGRKSGEKLAS